MARNNIKRRN